VNCAGRRAVIILLIGIAVDIIGGIGFAGRFKRRVGDNVFGLGLVALDALKVPHRELQSIENETGVLLIDLMTQDELGHAMECDLDAVGIVEDGQGYIGVRVIGNTLVVLKCDLTGDFCTKWNERESTWRKSGSCRCRGTNQSKS
jgi:hypothetical protein